MSIDTDKYFVHANGWWWGTAITIIRKDGVGMVELQIDREMPETCYVKGLSVLKPHRKQGTAKDLLNLCETVARQEGKSFLKLSVEKSNEWLVEWYKRIGFRVLGIDENTLEMLKPL